MGEEHHNWFTWTPPPECRGKFVWRANRPGFIPPHAFPAGRDKDGTPLYVGRAEADGDILPCKVKSHGNRAYVSYGGKEIVKYKFEILASHHVSWQFSKNGEINPQAMVIGKTENGENLYAGRAFHDGTITPGKIHPSHKCLYIPYHGEEIRVTEYEIMLLM